MAQFDLLSLLESLKGGTKPTSKQTMMTAMQLSLANEAKRRQAANQEFANMLGGVEAIDLTTNQLRYHQASIIEGIKGNMVDLYRSKKGNLNEEDRAAISTEMNRLDFYQQKLQNMQSFFNEANEVVRKQPGAYDKNMMAAEWQKMQDDPMNYTPENTMGFGETGNPFLSYQTKDPFLFLRNNIKGYRSSVPKRQDETEVLKGNKKYSSTVTEYGTPDNFKAYVMDLASRDRGFMKGIFQAYDINEDDEMKNHYITMAQENGFPPSIQALFNTQNFKDLENYATKQVDTSQTAYREPSKKGFYLNFDRGTFGYGNAEAPLEEYQAEGGHVYESFANLAPHNKKVRAVQLQGDIYKLEPSGVRRKIKEPKGEYTLEGLSIDDGVALVSREGRGAREELETLEIPIENNMALFSRYGVSEIPEPSKERGWYYEPTQEMVEKGLEEEGVAVPEKGIGRKLLGMNVKKDDLRDYLDAKYKEAEATGFELNEIVVTEDQYDEAFEQSGLKTEKEYVDDLMKQGYKIKIK